MASAESALWSIDSKVNSTLKKAGKIEGEVAALAVATAAIHNETKHLSTATDNIRTRLTEVEKKANDIQQMVFELLDQTRRQHLMQMAQTEIVKVRQDREKLYGNYDKVRKTTEGILLATDVGIVRQNTIVTSAEELRLSTPRYWLSSCLVALSAWINDDRKTGEAAVKEALRLDDEKTSLFFALLCRRASRGSACNEWLIRYLRGQDPENLDMRCVFVLDAYANGMFGIQGGNSVFDYMNEWVSVLSQKSDFEQKQILNWSNVVRSVMKMPDVRFKMLESECINKDVYKTKLLTAHLHGNLFDYVDSIMSVPVDTSVLRDKLDEILKELITLFDDDERVKVYEEKEMEYIIKYKGDQNRARAEIQLDKSKFEDTKDFTVILSEAAMGTQDVFSSPSTRKLSVAFCKDWIKNAYNDVLAKNRMTASMPLRFNVDNMFVFETEDGKNQARVLSKLDDEIKARCVKEKETIKNTFAERMTQGIRSAIITGIIAVIAGIAAFSTGSFFFGLVGFFFLIACIFNIYQSKWVLTDELSSAIVDNENKYKHMKERLEGYIKGICAEAYKLSLLVQEKNKDEMITLRLLDELSPELYVARYEDDKVRKVMV